LKRIIASNSFSAPATAPRAFYTSLEKEHPVTRHIEASVTFINSPLRNSP
jgi:hypothetical protein